VETKHARPVLLALVAILAICGYLWNSQRALDRYKAKLSCRSALHKMIRSLPEQITHEDFKKANPEMIQILGQELVNEIRCEAVQVRRSASTTAYLIIVDDQASLYTVQPKYLSRLLILISTQSYRLGNLVFCRFSRSRKALL
jgi:adenine C2-methylase RlmN of 23S rRNA A2503 and tRNA A37